MNTLAPVQPVFRQLVRTVVPESAALDEQAWQQVEELVETALRARPATLQRRVRLFLRFLEWLPVARYARRFTALDAARRVRFLAHLQEHPVRLIRVGFWGVRTLALLGYYTRPEVKKAIGYTPDPRGWEALR